MFYMLIKFYVGFIFIFVNNYFIGPEEQIKSKRESIFFLQKELEIKQKVIGDF